MGRTNVDYDAIYVYLKGRSGKVVSASSIAYQLGYERIYGGTMVKLTRAGWIEPCKEKGYYISKIEG